MILVCYLYEVLTLNSLNIKESINVRTIDTISLMKTVSLNRICNLYDRDELPSLVWSHRGRIGNKKNNIVDGSVEAISYLIHRNIINFDVDVSFVNEHNNFYVIHPTLLNKVDSIDDYLPLSEFLSIMHDTMKSRNSNKIIGFVTVEPKFNDSHLYDKMIEIIVSSNYVNNKIGNLGIIASSKKSYKALMKELEKYDCGVHIAIAFRTIMNNNENMFSWSGRDNIISSTNPIILMPDNKLLASDANNKKSANKIVAWTIDRIEDAYEALYHNVDGIISNTPVEILNILQKDYDKFCS